MKKIVIIGNSAAGVAAAEAVRDKDRESRLSIVSEEPFYAYQRHKILGLLEGNLKQRDLIFRNQDFYANHKIDLLLEKKVVELNLNKKRAVFKERDFVEFDVLIIAAGAGSRLPKLPGAQKEGVVAINGLGDVRFILENLPVAHTVVVAGSSPVAAEIARIIAAKKIEVKFFGGLPAPIEGVEVISDNPITEILGDSDVKAVRLSSQKVIGASLVIFAEVPQPRIDFLEGTGIQTDRGVIVDLSMRTNIPFVLACGDASVCPDKEKVYGWENAQSEGRLAGGISCQI